MLAFNGAALGYCIKLPRVNSCTDACEHTHERARERPSAVARFLGTSSMWQDAATELPPAGACADESEEEVFRRVCASTITAFDAHLESTHRRRALFWSFEGKSDWGWGHALPFAALLHAVCRRGAARTRRFKGFR